MNCFLVFCFVSFRFVLFFHSQPCLFTVQTELVQILKSQDAQSRTRSTVPFSPLQSCSALEKLQPPSEIKTPKPHFWVPCEAAEQPRSGVSSSSSSSTKARGGIPSTRSASTKNIPRVLEFHLKAKKKSGNAVFYLSPSKFPAFPDFKRDPWNSVNEWNIRHKECFNQKKKKKKEWTGNAFPNNKSIIFP